MIKRIVVALDADTDTPVATRYATEIAREHSAELTGMAVVDTASISASSKGGGIGSMYLMSKVQESLTVEAREIAQALTRAFRDAVKESGIQSQVVIEEGVALQRIIEDMNCRDLLVIGKEPHFFYSHPDETSTKLEEIVSRVVSPTCVIPSTYRKVERVMIAYDGSAASVRAMRSFFQLKPFGSDVTVEAINVHSKGERASALLALAHVKAYGEAHGYSIQTLAFEGTDPSKEIVEALERHQADVLVAGAHIVSPLSRIAFGSTSASLLHQVNIPMWLEA